MISQRSGSSKWDATPCVAAMQPHRLPVGDYISIPPFHFLQKHSSPFAQKALHTFMIFQYKKTAFPAPAPWDECLEKETQVDFFRDEAATIPSSRGFQTAHYLPKERQHQKGCNALALLRCNRIGCLSETISLNPYLLSCSSIRPLFP